LENNFQNSFNLWLQLSLPLTVFDVFNLPLSDQEIGRSPSLIFMNATALKQPVEENKCILLKQCVKFFKH